MNPREENSHFPTFVNHFCIFWVVIFGCKHLSACCRRGNSLCSMNVGILCENCIMIIFATSENTTSRWMLPRLYEIRCIRNCFLQHVKTTEKKIIKKYKTWNTNTFPDIFLAKRMSPWSSDAADSHTMQSLSLTLALMPNICNLWCNCCDFL